MPFDFDFNWTPGRSRMYDMYDAHIYACMYVLLPVSYMRMCVSYHILCLHTYIPYVCHIMLLSHIFFLWPILVDLPWMCVLVYEYIGVRLTFMRPYDTSIQDFIMC